MVTYKKNNKKGFTLIEVMVTLMIVVLLAGIGAPSLLGFIESGKQTNRNHVARTLFVAAQSGLTNMKINEQLEEYVKFEKNAQGVEVATIVDTAHVKKVPIDVSTNDTESTSDTENANYIYYMVIEEGVGDTLLKLLDSYVLEKDVLKNSICLEFNAKTGVAKSIFFSESFTPTTHWTYTGNDINSLVSRNPDSLRTKKQGFYGVDKTGAVSPDSLPITIELKDAADEISGIKNALYVEAKVPKGSKRAYTLELLDKEGTILKDKDGTDIKFAIANAEEIVAPDLGNAFSNKIDGKHLVFKQNDDAEPLYTKITWVIDVVNNNTTNYTDMTDSIGVKYGITPQIISAKITESISNRVEKSNKAPSHFGSKQGEFNQIKDTRHLNNIRYAANQNFLQMNDIIASDYNGDSDTLELAPLEVGFTDAETPSAQAFSGKYYGARSDTIRYTIYNLKINSPKGITDIGMFGAVTGQIINTSIDNATITGNGAKAAENVGGLVGSLTDGKITGSSAFANVTTSGTAIKNVGGLVGIVTTGSTLETSFNAGYYNAWKGVEAGKFGSVKANKGNVGGLVGSNAGTVTTSFNNARVNIESVTIGTVVPDIKLSMNPKPSTSQPSTLGGIVGENLGTVKDTYATNYVGIYPDKKGGGIVGDGNVAVNSYYISNGNSDLTALSKKELAEKAITGFAAGNFALYVQGQNTYDKYPYPVLATNPVVRKDVEQNPIPTDKRGWEDIKEIIPTTATLSYYERYSTNNDPTKAAIFGYWSGGENENPTPIQENLLVNNDGYCLEFGFASEYKIVIHNKEYVLNNNNSTENTVWNWSTNPEPKMSNLPQKIANVGGKSRYRLFLDNEVVEKIAYSFIEPGLLNYGKPMKIQILSASGKRMLDGSADKKDAVDGIPAVDATDVYFNPMFAKSIYRSEDSSAIPIINDYLIRSPRHIDNIDKAIKGRYKQELDIDFEVYRRELEFHGDTISLDDTKKMPTDKSVVDNDVKGGYDGDHHFIRNVKVNDTSKDSTSLGLFKQVGNVVKNVVLIQSSFEGGGNVGAIAGRVVGEGVIQNCEVSEVTVKGTTNVGGIVGNNSGKINNVYFNSTYRDKETGIYAAPVTGATNVGGLVGINYNKLTNAYSTAIGHNKKPTVGAVGTPVGTGISGTISNVFYLSDAGYNAGAVKDATQGVAKNPTDLAAALTGDDWEAAILDTTKDTKTCIGKPYPFPKIKDSNHYYDWPILISTFKYYEVYSDKTIGYYSFVDTTDVTKPSDTLKYTNGLTVIEEGYLIDVNTAEKFDIRFNNETTSSITKCESTVFDGRRVIKLAHSDVEGKIDTTATNVTATGMKPVQISVSLMVTETNKVFTNILFGSDTAGKVYFNPLFAKEIVFVKDNADPPVKNAFSIRSPRQMMNINTGGVNMRGYNYTQTISMNFAREEGVTGGHPLYKKDDTVITQIGNHVVSGLTGHYDGVCPDGSSRIYNLTMNVSDSETVKNNFGGTFGNTSTNSMVSNIEFVDPQIRYAGNGMGGGIVANVNYGIIDNVNVYNTVERQLFTDIDGTVSNQFCADRKNVTGWDLSLSSHAHGGIAGYAIGENAKITNCIVGTNSDNIYEIFDNKVKITCFSSGFTPEKGAENENKYFTLMGGIVGGATGGAQVISCVNISTIEPNTTLMDTRNNSTHCVGGIVGRMGNSDRNHDDGKSSYSIVIGCYNAGTVKVSYGYLGGIVGRTAGMLNGQPSKVTSCYNTGRLNIEYGSDGTTLKQSVFKDKFTSLRIGGICGETDLTRFSNCYNIGYLSGNTSSNATSAAGAIIGLPTYTNTIVENSFSLAANQFRPVTIVGPKLYKGGTVNGITDGNKFEALFGDFWETRANLRNNKVLTNPNYHYESYPGLGNLGTGPKGYPVFQTNPNTFYIYPELTNFVVDGVTYQNPHITPWEYVDAIFDTTLKYYEKYTDDKNESTTENGEFYLNIRGEKIDTLQQERVVREDGYYLAIGQVGNYKVVINGKEFTAEAKAGVHETTDIGIEFTTDMLEECKSGYNKIRLFTMLKEDSAQNTEDNKINRLVGTSTTADGTTGNDLYFDYYFPREIQLAPTATTPMNDNLTIRSPRHLVGISKSTAMTPNQTDAKNYTQELDLDFKEYTSLATLIDSVVTGNFGGVYNGKYKTISNVTIVATDAIDVGLFAHNKGTIQNIKLENSSYTSQSITTLNMGAIAAQNEGTIVHIAIVRPTLTGSAAPTITAQTIGGIAGMSTASGIINDTYLVANDTEALTPITATTGAVTLGGLVGDNAGEIDRALYLAKAPSTTAVVIPPATTHHPITRINTGIVGTNIHYLSGVAYNDFIVDANTVGTPKSTVELTKLRNELTADWVANWGTVTEYPYPSLINITPPATFPIAKPVKNTLAYYEKYKAATPDIETYGWYFYEEKDDTAVTLVVEGKAAEVTDPLNARKVSIAVTDTLDKTTKVVEETGYCVIVPKEGTYSVIVGTATAVDIEAIEVDKKWIIQIPAAAPPIIDPTPIKLQVGGKDLDDKYTYYNPMFAKGIYNDIVLSADVAFSISTPAQMQNIGAMTTVAAHKFIQERNLDFTNVALTGSVVKGTFAGAFDGNGKSISNVTINQSTADNIGLFSQNSGTIKGITLKPTTKITGKDNVGGIVGSNLAGAKIENCTVEGDADKKGMDITGTNNVGGIAGTNAGAITGCTVQNTTSTIKGIDYVGGIAGLNETTGTITGAVVNNVKIDAPSGANSGALCGKNNNSGDSVNGTITNVELVGKVVTTALEAAITEANKMLTDTVWGKEVKQHSEQAKTEYEATIKLAQTVLDRAKPPVVTENQTTPQTEKETLPVEGIAITDTTIEPKPVTQQEIDDAVVALKTAMNKVKGSTIFGIKLAPIVVPLPPDEVPPTDDTATSMPSSEASSESSSVPPIESSSEPSSIPSSAPSSEASSEVSSEESSTVSPSSVALSSSVEPSSTIEPKGATTRSGSTENPSNNASSSGASSSNVTSSAASSSNSSSSEASSSEASSSEASSSIASSSIASSSNASSSNTSSIPTTPIEPPLVTDPIIDIIVADPIVDELGTALDDRAVSGKNVTVTISNIAPENQITKIAVTDESSQEIKTTQVASEVLGTTTFSFIMPAASVQIDIIIEPTPIPIKEFEPLKPVEFPPVNGLSIAGLPLYFLDRHEKLRKRGAKWFTKKSKKS